LYLVRNLTGDYRSNATFDCRCGQRNYLFTYDGRKYGPCLNIPKALVVYTRGSGFREDSPIPPSFDHQAPYIDFWLRLIGVHEVLSVVVDNAWNQDHAQSAASLAAAKQSVERIVRGFWCDGASALSLSYDFVEQVSA
jgi:hypothetical protein